MRAGRRFAVRRDDLGRGAMPVPAEWELDGRTEAAVVLEHRPEAGPLVRAVFPVVVEDDGEGGLRFAGLTWPADVHPGVLVAVSWRGARGEALARTAVLEEPMSIDGVEYRHEYDPRVVTRECPPEESNRGKVLLAVRRLGVVFDDGSAVFPEADLPARSGLGRGAKGKFLLRNAIDQLIREGYVTRVTGSLDEAGRPGYPADPAREPVEMLFYAPLTEPLPHGEHAERHEHWVSGFFRKLPPGAQPSPKALALYRQAVENAQITGPLAPGYTYVQKHHRH